MVRSRFSAPATTLPAELLNATCWNQPSRTSTLIDAVGNTLVALSAGRNVTAASAGGLAFSDCLVDPPKHAANTLGAKTPTARVVRARRRVNGERSRAVLTTSRYRRKRRLSSARDSQGAADQHRFGYQCDTKHIAHPVAHGTRQGHHVGVAGSAAVGQRPRVLGGKSAAGAVDVRVTLVEAGLLDEPARGELDAVRRRVVRHRTISTIGQLLVMLLCDNGIGEERPDAPGVVVLRVQHHALARAQG